MSRILIKLHASHDHIVDSLNNIPVPARHQTLLTQNVIEGLRLLRPQHQVFSVFTESNDDYDHMVMLAPGSNAAPGVGLQPTHFITEKVFWVQWDAKLKTDSILSLSARDVARLAIKTRREPYPYTHRLITTTRWHADFYGNCIRSCSADKLLDNLIYIQPISFLGFCVGMEIALTPGSLSEEYTLNHVFIDE